MTICAATTFRISAVVVAVGLLGSLVGCADSGPSNDVPPPAASSPSDGQSGSDSPQDGVGMEQAGMIATDKYGGTVSSIEDDSYKGEPAWEVEINDSNEGRIEVKVSKATGDILVVEQE